MCKVCSLDAESLQVVGIVLKEQSLGQRVRFGTMTQQMCRWQTLHILTYMQKLFTMMGTPE